MPADVKTNMSVTGVAQFKQAMSQSKAAVKALDAELKLSAAQYKATGDAEDYARQKSELLRKQIAEQEKVVKAAEDALEQMVKNGADPASKAFIAMKTSLAQAKTQLTNMQTELKGVGDAGKAAATETGELDKSLKNINKGISFQNVTSGISSITSAAGKAVSGVANLSKAIWGMTTDAAEYFDEAATKAEQYGIDRDLYIRMNSTLVTDQTDINADDLLAATTKLYQNAENGAISIAEGYQYTLTTNRLQDLFGILQKVDELATKGKINKADALQKLFGKSFTKLATYDYSSYMELLESVDVIDDEQVDNLLSFSDALAEMNQSIETFKNTTAAELAGGFQSIAGAISTVFQSLTDWANSPEGKEALNSFSENIAGIITDFAETDWTDLMDDATKAINGVVDAFKWIRDNKDSVKTWLEIIAGGFVALKGIEISGDIVKLVSGLSSLGGGAGIASGLGSLGLALSAMTLTVGTAYIVAQNREEIAADMHDAALDSPEAVQDWVESFTSDVLNTSGTQAALDRFMKTKTPVSQGAFVVQLPEGTTIEAPAADAKQTEAREWLDNYDLFKSNPFGMFSPNNNPWGGGYDNWYRNMEAVYTQNGYDYYSKMLNPEDTGWGDGTLIEEFDSEVEEVSYTVEDLKDYLSEGTSLIDYFCRMVGAAAETIKISGFAGAGVTPSAGDTTMIDRLIINGATNPIELYRELQKQGIYARAGYGS